MTSATQHLLSEAYDKYRRGDLNGAETIALRLGAPRSGDAALRGLLGMIAMARGDYGAAAAHLSVALASAPDVLDLRVSLALALANSGQLDRARDIALGGQSPRLDRIIGYVAQQQGRGEEAIAVYRRVVGAVPEDHQSWLNLATLLAARGGIDEAIAAYERVLTLQPGPAAYLGLARALASVARHDERRALLRRAAAGAPGDAEVQIDLGLAEGTLDDFAAAETAFERAVALAPQTPRGWLEYGMLLLRLNRIEALAALIARAERAGATGSQLDFLCAWLLRRQGRFADALALAESAEGIAPGRQAELIGELADRLGDSDRAFAAFTAMNAASAVGPAAEYARSLDYPGEIARETGRLTPAWIASWSSAAGQGAPRAPIFIVGFPRSGTTLLDTLLMNLPELAVFEEAPMLARTAEALGDFERLATLTSAEVDRLREIYLTEAQRLDGGLSGRRIVDKFPLHCVRVPLIHRLFPDARFVFVERHPCDAVLSCFMNRFQINRANVQFLDLASAARFYDTVLSAWSVAASRLPIAVHRVRYERLVADPTAEMRALFEAVGLDWRDAVLDNLGSAARRDHIPTPSYAQVVEPINSRAVGRWRRYKRQMANILPILQPWAAWLGYADMA